MENSSQSPITSGFKFSMSARPKFLIVVIVIIIAVTAGGYWYWSKSKQSRSSQGAPSLGNQLFDKTQNPLKGKLPDTNPFDDQPNPFGDKTNPIEKAYTNPF